MPSGDCIDLVFTVDDGYTEAFLAALVSIGATTGSELRLNIISTQGAGNLGKSISLIEQLGLPYRLRSSADVEEFFTRRPSLREKFTYDAHYYRIFAPDLFPEVERAIYLDADLVVRGDLHKLWNVELEGNVIGAVADPTFLTPRHADFRAAYGGSYFNSGVMLWDLARWRADQVGPSVCQWIARFTSEGPNAGIWQQFWDQSPLNRALQGKWVPLSPTWNCSIRTHPTHSEFYGVNREEMLAILEDAAIYHFVGAQKPWKPEYAALNKYFIEYRDHSQLARRLCSTIALKSAVTPQEKSRLDGKPLDFANFAAILFKALSEKISPVSFVQVGAHDGISGDPINRLIRQFGWRGLLIEPVPYLFERLQKNYRDIAGLIFESVCVSPNEGTATFYHMRDVHPPPVGWYSQLSSFRKEVILKHKKDIPDIESFIQEAELVTMRLETLVSKHRLRVDALIVDTEGYDAQVISSIDLIKHDPFVIYFEHKHLPTNEAVELLGRLKSLGYVVVSDTINVLAAKPVIIPPSVLREISGSSVAGFRLL